MNEVLERRLRAIETWAEAYDIEPQPGTAYSDRMMDVLEGAFRMRVAQAARAVRASDDPAQQTQWILALEELRAEADELRSDIAEGEDITEAMNDARDWLVANQGRFPPVTGSDAQRANAYARSAREEFLPTAASAQQSSGWGWVLLLGVLWMVSRGRR